MDRLATANAAEIDAVLRNRCTKLFFRMGIPAAARPAAKQLALHAAKLPVAVNSPSARTSDILRSLGLGQTVVLGRTEDEVVRVPRVNIRG